MKADEIKVTIITYDRTYDLTSVQGTKLKDLLDSTGISYSLPCTGAGRCGRCRVRFTKGAPEARDDEKAKLTEEEIFQGYRLLCRCILEDNCAISLTDAVDEENISIETVKKGTDRAIGKSDNLGIAIDLGTTTIAAALIRPATDSNRSDDSPSYEVLGTASCVNHQRKYGNDVISRIAAAEDSETAKELQSLVITDIEELIQELIKEFGGGSTGDISNNPSIGAITIAGNTTMLHLLEGMDASGLGKYPYTPVSTAMVKMDSDRLFGSIRGAKLTILPGISSFAGADIVGGLFSLTLRGEERYFFIDLGTNGEMAFFDGENLKVTSAAAGPVFEAGGISCGVASIPGAISHVEIDETTSRAKYETIQRQGTSSAQPPIGLCGTAVCEITSELARSGIMDETGLLSDEYFDEGFPVTEDGQIRFTQQDIRNVQLAKAAILTGAGTLVGEMIPDKVYIAGGFGSHIIPEKIARLRMFPEGFDGKIIAAGNTSLKGAAMYTAAVLLGSESEAAADAKLGHITDTAQTVELAAIDSFDEAYLEAMNF
ncbi:ASKHA domain-containing protein [Butyrivibrio sp. AE3009]|uniref:ASKHA domain-containing protein n=1 Tax=Butyrivibrio sp. AE3009 TaxID=1280666 RepID=UPI0003B485ED|nr:ASKHA domain-containing protein [Butyrivibrio sp. AE3009]